MDVHQDGRINSADLHKALEKVGAAIEEAEMQELFSASDIDGTGHIDYEVGFFNTLKNKCMFWTWRFTRVHVRP